MKTRDCKVVNFNGYGRDSKGYLTTYKFCSRKIYMKYSYGKFKPFESWIAEINTGEWIFHNCNYSLSTKQPTKQSKNFRKRINSKPAAKPHYCPKCHIELPCANNICNYCGFDARTLS